MDLITLMGVVGASLVLFGFVANRLHYWHAGSPAYVRVNALGSLVLIVYSVLIESYPFVILNVVWLLFSINDVFTARKPIGANVRD